MTIAVVVQARMTSSRLPGKVMLPLDGKPMLHHVLSRCLKIDADMVILATPADKDSDPMFPVASALGVTVALGPEDDVLARYWNVSQIYPHDHYMRITADCPMIDPEVCNRVVALHLADENDYTSNVHPRGFPKGLDCEIFTHDMLQRANAHDHSAEGREHVTPWMWRTAKAQKLLGNLDGPGTDHVNYCVDTMEDYEWMSKIFKDIE